MTTKHLGRVLLLAAAAVAAALPARATTRYLDPLFAVAITPDLAYGAATNNRGELETLRLDLYEPAGDTLGARPAIVWAHGGGFTGGNRTAAPIVALARAFAERGYVTASISYRVRPPGTPGSPSVPDLIVGSLAGELHPAMRDAQHDMQAAVRWLRAEAAGLRVDPARIVVGGISAGASMSLETAFNPDDPGASGNPGHPSDVAAAIPVSGGSDPRRIEPGAPPLGMFHGTNDTTAPYAFAATTCATSVAHGNACELTTYPGAGHDLTAHHDDIVARTADLLCRRVVACD